MIKQSFGKKLISFILVFLSCILIGSFFCACNTDESADDTISDNTDSGNYPVEGIWCGAISGADLKNVQGESLANKSTMLNYYIWFLPGGGIKTAWEIGQRTGEWNVENYAWEINGYIVDLSTDVKLIIVDDVFKFKIPTINCRGDFWYNKYAQVSTFSKVEDENLIKNKFNG